MKVIPYCVEVVTFICVVCASDESSEDLMLPYERNSIDDCNIRYYREKGFDGYLGIGTPAYPGEFAHMVVIGWKQPDGTVKWDCGGSLIWDNIVLTTAHCTVSHQTGLDPDVIRIGDLDLNDDKDDKYVQERKIVNITRHPLYNLSTVYHDLALLKLDQNVTTSWGAIPTCLWLDDHIPFRDVQAAGCGSNGFGLPSTNILTKSNLKLMSNEDCQRYNNKRTHVRLRNGLQDHQLCAWDEVHDTCPGDSGGPLHHKLVYGNKLVPFLVGVTSFGKVCGLSQPGVYVKVSKYKQWIIGTMQQFGQQVTASMFEPLTCAARYNPYRELNPFNLFFSPRESIVRLLKVPQSASDRCVGALIEPDAVITLAECVTVNGSTPTHVLLFESELIEIEEIVVHPNYTAQLNHLYSNIAVLKLKTFSTFHPHCIGFDRRSEAGLETIGFIPHVYQDDTDINSYEPVLMTNMLLSEEKCYASPTPLPQTLENEHFCFKNEKYIVPGSCNLALGGPIYADRIYGIALTGRDCGFGEAAVGLLLKSYKPWLESLFLPAKTQQETADLLEALSYIDPDLVQGDLCGYSNNVEGICVPLDACSDITRIAKNQKRVVFCGSSMVVCCPKTIQETQELTDMMMEFNECEARYQRFKENRNDKWNKDKQLMYSHMAAVGWEQKTEIKFECFGYLISTRGVVTAASCLMMQSTEPTIVRLGWHGWKRKKVYSTIQRIESIVVHPKYNLVTRENDIAVIKLLEVIKPSLYFFPGCLWQNKTHAPVKQTILNDASGEFDNIHPLYSKDCEKRLNQSMVKPEIGCMNAAYNFCRVTTTGYYNIALFNFCLTRNANNSGNDGVRCYKPGNPIVWRKQDKSQKTRITEYLVGIYSYGDCYADISLRIVHRVAFYIEWFAHVLQ